jgi:hypothetical protein
MGLIIIFVLFIFGAYRVWKRDSFLGAKRQWLKLLLYVPVCGIASIALLLEAIVSGLRKKPISNSINPEV